MYVLFFFCQNIFENPLPITIGNWLGYLIIIYILLFVRIIMSAKYVLGFNVTPIRLVQNRVGGDPEHDTRTKLVVVLPGRDDDATAKRFFTRNPTGTFLFEADRVHSPER